MQAAWRALLGKAHLLDQDPLLSETTIPEADWDRRFEKRAADALLRRERTIDDIIFRIRGFQEDLEIPGYNFRPVLKELLIDIEEAERVSQLHEDMRLHHHQLAMELSNYVKKLVRRYTGMTDAQARQLAYELETGNAASAVASAAASSTASTASTASPASVASSAASSPASVELGAGGFGVVIKPALPNTNEAGVLHEYPDNVTKLFIERRNRDKILTLAPLLNRIMGPNEGHRINTYRKAYKGRNVPESSRRKLGIRESNNVYPIRMPDLGVSIHDLYDRRQDLRKIPVTTILGQVVKVLKQVQTLQASGYIHGDIRDTNVMIHPATGIITIIDFDLLRPVDEFRRRTSFGMYNNPPELVLLFPDRIDSYVASFYKWFTFVQELFEGPAFILEMEDVIEKVQATVSRIGESRVLSKSLTTFDSFGIGCTLLTMFEILYPGSIKNDKAVLKTSLQARITNNGVPYTDVEMDAIVNAIYDMSHNVLLMLSKFRMDFRPKAEGVIDIAIEIERKLRESIKPVNRVGGKRTRTHRRSSQRTRRTR